MSRAGGSDSIDSASLVSQRSSLSFQTRAYDVINSRSFKISVILLAVLLTVIVLQVTNKTLTDIMFVGGIMGAVCSVSVV